MTLDNAATASPSDRRAAASPRPTQPALVSVVIPCFNAGPWVGQAIESALGQTYRPIEVVVVDDGSTDGSLNVINGFGNRVVCRSTPHRGGNAARNLGLGLSRGDFIQWLDGDDYLLPHKVTEQVSFLQEHPDVDVVFGDWRHLHCAPDGSACLDRVVTASQPDDMLFHLLGSWWAPHHAYLVRRSAAMAGGGWDERLSAAQDFDYWVGIALAGGAFRYLAGCGAIYRRYGAVTVSTSNRSRWLVGQAAVLARAESSLKSRERLSPAYRHVLAERYLQVARSWFDLDRTLYEKYLAHARELNAHVGQAQGRSYRWASRALGHHGAEHLAQLKRRLPTG